MRAASCESPASSGSIVPISRLALYPPETPANAAASPAIGCRPTERKITADKGTSRTYPTSLAAFDITPEKTMTMQEFNSIVHRFGNEEFGSKHIQNALIGSGIGLRKLQPTLGLILKGMYGESPIEKVPGVDKGPGVRYRKVK